MFSIEARRIRDVALPEHPGDHVMNHLWPHTLCLANKN
jgi:hypothetical protein